MFGFWKKKAPPVYLVMDRGSNLLAKAELLGEPDAEQLEIKITEGRAEDVEKAEIVQVIPSIAKEPVLMATILSRRAAVVTVEPLRQLGSEVRRNFRMPVAFDSYVYYLPLGGRAPFRSVDLSCGGIAFETEAELEPGELCEVVVPMTAEGPLIVRTEILRANPVSETARRYGAKFSDIIDDEEALLREAVFNIQLESVRISRQRSMREGGGARKRG